MSIGASKLFEFLADDRARCIERHEIVSVAFDSLRRCLRNVVLSLHGSGSHEAVEVSYRLRALLSEWLTVPVPFDCATLRAFEAVLGTSDRVQSRWGSDIRDLYDRAVQAARDLDLSENPARDWLRGAIRELRADGRSFKVFCNRRGRVHFESLFETGPWEKPLASDVFLHSARDYREASLFDTLVKMGPLRAQGWGSIPDAVLTAPRFDTLLQIVWHGCGDEPGFGYDPGSSMFQPSDGERQETPGHVLGWTKRIIFVGGSRNDLDSLPGEPDDLRIFGELGRTCDKRMAVLIQVDDQQAILFPRFAQVLTFDADQAARDPVALRTPGETLSEGMYLIMPIIADVDLGGVRAQHGQFSRLWKPKLEREWRTDPSGLVRRLKTGGLNLVQLSSAIRHWTRAPTTVIHAPQQVQHFRVLMQVLGIDDHSSNHSSFWQLAWNEIRQSRGEAIQAGVQEQEIVEAQLLVILRDLLPKICDSARTRNYFSVDMPEGSELNGTCYFLKVLAIEDGFRAPETELKVLRNLQQADQWRD